MEIKKKAILEITNAIQIHLREVDRIMKMKETFERGKLIAQSCNKLDMAHDAMLHFELGYSLNKIGKDKRVYRYRKNIIYPLTLI